MGSAVTTISIRLDTSGVSKGRRDLGGATTSTAKLERELRNLRSTLRVTNDQMSSLGVRSRKTSKDLNKASKQVKQASSRFGGLSSQVMALAGAYVGLQGAIRAVSLADELTGYENRLKAATRETGNFVQVSKEMFGISQRVGVQLGANIGLFQNLKRSAIELGASDKDIFKVQEAIGQLGIISGASNTDLKFALRQFSQSMAAGIVRAEEFNSIVENTPELANKIAKGMGLTVGKLRLAVLDGKVLSKEVFASLLGQTQEINSEFAEVERRIPQAGSAMRNSFQAVLGKVDEITNATSGLVAAIMTVSTFLDRISGAGNKFKDINRGLSADELIEYRNELERLIKNLNEVEEVTFFDRLKRSVDPFGRLKAALQDISITLDKRDIEDYEKSLKEVNKQISGIPTDNIVKAKKALDLTDQISSLQKIIKLNKDRIDLLSSDGVTFMEEKTLLILGNQNKQLEEQIKLKRQIIADANKQESGPAPVTLTGQARLGKIAIERGKSPEQRKIDLINKIGEAQTRVSIATSESIDKESNALVKLLNNLDKITEAEESRVEARKGRLESLRESMMTENEIILNAHKKRNEEIRELTIAGTKEQEDLLKRSARRKGTDESELNKKKWNDAVSGMSDFQDNMEVLARTGNKKAFKLAQGAAIAETIMSTAASAQNAFKSFSGLGPWGIALGIAAAGAATAAGLARVATIKNQRMAFDMGGHIPAGSEGLVGEKGPEIVKGPAFVTSRQTTAAKSNSTSSGNVNITINTYNAPAETTIKKKVKPSGNIVVDIIYPVIAGLAARDIRSNQGSLNNAIRGLK